MKKPAKFDKTSPLQIGILQGGLVSLYVLLFASIVTGLDKSIPQPSPALAVSAFLLAFIISALVCASAVFGYPLVLAFKGKIKRAIEIVAWTAATIMTIALLVLFVIVSMF